MPDKHPTPTEVKNRITRRLNGSGISQDNHAAVADDLDLLIRAARIEAFKDLVAHFEMQVGQPVGRC